MSAEGFNADDEKEEGAGLTLNRVTALGVLRNVVPTSGVDGDRELEVLVEVVDVLEDVSVVRARNGDVVDEGEVDDVSGSGLRGSDVLVAR
jgi:hypothetical protein